MTWNYRLVRRRFFVANKKKYTYAIHEAYYDDAGKVWSITEEPVPVFGDTPKQALEAYNLMKEALKYPVLDANKVPEKGATPLW